jgi:hypothetical protein
MPHPLFCLRRFVLSFALMVGVCLPVLGSMGCQSNSVQTLSAGPLPEHIEITYSWHGLSPTLTEETFDLTLSEDQHFYHAQGATTILPVDTQQAAHTQPIETRIPTATVTAVLDTLRLEKWKPSQSPAEVIDHPDDFPRFTLTFKRPHKPSFRLSSTSNTVTGAPWNLQVRKKLYINDDPKVGTVIYELLEKVRTPATQL